MAGRSVKELLQKIEDLESKLADSEQIVEAIKAGQVDAFAVNVDNQSEVYTLQSGDYAYRLLIEEFGEGALNVTEDGLIVYTNTYLADLINMPYEKIVGSYIGDLVHIDHVQIFNRLFDEAKHGKSKGEINLVAGDKVIPVYISLTSLQPKLATVGIIISDLTYRKKHQEVILKYQQDLESKNKELTQSNAELASFNYIASHDLQEPLRKIQVFSDLILSKEESGLSDKTKDYFSRITSATSRMQSLLLALLNYSRSNNFEALFVPTDLNAIIENVKNDLSELLEANSATIETSGLPTLSIIPDQFSQFFTNMITNAVKYKRDEHPPIIKISAQKMEGAAIPLYQVDPHTVYWNINISDNGMGFEQHYSEKIFELFQRLHTKHEYEGTGVGLAICKKIIQNHHGLITATGNPGLGSVFSVYIPVK